MCSILQHYKHQKPGSGLSNADLSTGSISAVLHNYAQATYNPKPKFSKVKDHHWGREALESTCLNIIPHVTCHAIES